MSSAVLDGSMWRFCGRKKVGRVLLVDVEEAFS
jgi:hypothetical protein